MKKYVFLLSAAFSFLCANGIDTESVKVEFEGYKTSEMVGTKGVFKTGKFMFGKDNSSISSQLKNAKAVLSTKDIDMHDDNGIITTNIVQTFFEVLKANSDIHVSFENVVEGKDMGVITAKVTIGKESDLVPMAYKINDGKLVAKGDLDLHAFKNSSKALKALSDVAPGHKGISWPLVEIVFSADMK